MTRPDVPQPDMGALDLLDIVNTELHELLELIALVRRGIEGGNSDEPSFHGAVQVLETVQNRLEKVTATDVGNLEIALKGHDR